MLPLLGLAQTNSKVEMPMVENTISEKQPLEIKRNATYNLEEIKVRWKKAALENCPGVPCIVAPPFTCGTTTISDLDGNSYNTVLIGTQCWTKENLKVTKYNDGTTIPDETANTGGWGGLTTGARSDYTGAASYIANYGYLYNWYAAVGIVTPMGGSPTKNICPTGWHVPTNTEWTTLTDYLGGLTVAGTVMKKDDAKWTSNTGTNTSVFSGLPGGYRVPGSFSGIGSSAFFWSASGYDPSIAWNRSLSGSNGLVGSNVTNKSTGLSVRCLRD